MRAMLGRVKDQFDLHPERLIADAAYGSGPMLDWVGKCDFKPHIPVLHCLAVHVYMLESGSGWS